MDAREAPGFGDDKFRRLAELSPFGIWQVAIDGRTLYANPAMCALLEVADRAELENVCCYDFIAREDLERTRVEHARRRAGVSSSYEIVLVGRRGGRRTVIVSGTPVYGEDGRVEGMIASFHDITERRRAERELARQSGILATVLNQMSDGVCVTDENGRFLIFNPAGERIAGVGAIESSRPERWTRDYGIFRPDGVTPYPPEELPLARAMRGESPEQEVLLLRHPKRPEGVFVSISGRPLRDEEGNPKGAVVVVRDITQQRRLEDEARRLARMDALGRLAAGVAHDFGTLATAIRCYALAALQRTPASDPRHEDLEQILVACGHASALSRQFIDFSRGTPLATEPLEIASAVRSIEPLARLLAGRAIDVEVRLLAPPGAFVCIDRGQLERVLLNLVANARDAMPAGGRVSIEVEAVELDEPVARGFRLARAGAFVRIAVADTGPGLSAEVQARVFDPYFSTKAEGAARGLGLFVVYGIVRQAGGHVTVRSVPGEGATFEVYLPRIDGGEAPPAPPAACRRAIVLAPPTDPLRAAAEAALVPAGYATTTVATVAAAIDAATVLPRVDLVLIGWGVPDRERREIEERLAATHHGARILRLGPTATAADVATLVGDGP